MKKKTFASLSMVSPSTTSSNSSNVAGGTDIDDVPSSSSFATKSLAFVCECHNGTLAMENVANGIDGDLTGVGIDDDGATICTDCVTQCGLCDNVVCDADGHLDQCGQCLRFICTHYIPGDTTNEFTLTPRRVQCVSCASIVSSSSSSSMGDTRGNGDGDSKNSDDDSKQADDEQLYDDTLDDDYDGHGDMLPPHAPPMDHQLLPGAVWYRAYED